MKTKTKLSNLCFSELKYVYICCFVLFFPFSFPFMPVYCFSCFPPVFFFFLFLFFLFFLFFSFFFFAFSRMQKRRAWPLAVARAAAAVAADGPADGLRRRRARHHAARRRLPWPDAGAGGQLRVGGHDAAHLRDAPGHDHGPRRARLRRLGPPTGRKQYIYFL